MKVVAYLRVSTDRQAEEGFGLEIQKSAIQAWAKANKHKIVGWFSDEGISGSNGIDTRVALHEGFDVIRSGGARGFVVYRLDRLARDLILQEQLLADIRRYKAEAFSTSAAEAGYLGDDPDDPSRKLIRQVLGAVSEYERSMISLRLRSGRRRKADKGGFAYGSPPYGFNAADGELVANSAQQEAIKRIAELHKAGSSLREIAATLEVEGLKPKRSDRWHPESLRRIVARL